MRIMFSVCACATRRRMYLYFLNVVLHVSTLGMCTPLSRAGVSTDTSAQCPWAALTKP